MTHNKQKTNYLALVSGSIAALYVLIVSLFVVLTSGVFVWPLVLFLTISAYSLYTLVKIYKKELNKLLLWSIFAQALLATILLYPAAAAFVADYIGLSCARNESCSNDPFFPIGVKIMMLVPMLVIAVFSYYRIRVSWDKPGL